MWRTLITDEFNFDLMKMIKVLAEADSEVLKEADDCLGKEGELLVKGPNVFL